MMQNKSKVLTITLLWAALETGLLFAPRAVAQSSSSGSVTATGTDCTTTNACVTLKLPTSAYLRPGAATITVSGTFSATLEFEQSADNGTSWVSASGLPQPSGVAATSTTAAGLWLFDVSARSHLRVRASAYTSGTAVVTILSSPGMANVKLNSLTNADASKTVALGAYDITLTSTSGSLLLPRTKTSMTALAGGDFALSAGWGTTASVGTITGADQAFQFTVTSAGTGQGASPTVTLTFKDGTWGSAPALVCSMNGGTGTLAFTPVATTATAAVITYNGTPVATSTYIITCTGTGL